MTKHRLQLRTRLPAVQDGVVQPYADSPLDEEPMAETVYLNILAQAQRYVYIYINSIFYPFIRNAVGAMDFTPGSMISARPHARSWGPGSRTC